SRSANDFSAVQVGSFAFFRAVSRLFSAAPRSRRGCAAITGCGALGVSPANPIVDVTASSSTMLRMDMGEALYVIVKFAVESRQSCNSERELGSPCSRNAPSGRGRARPRRSGVAAGGPRKRRSRGVGRSPTLVGLDLDLDERAAQEVEQLRLLGVDQHDVI